MIACVNVKAREMNCLVTHLESALARITCSNVRFAGLIRPDSMLLKVSGYKLSLKDQSSVITSLLRSCGLVRWSVALTCSSKVNRCWTQMFEARNSDQMVQFSYETFDPRLPNYPGMCPG
jgi:hypothetical protein